MAAAHQPVLERIEVIILVDTSKMIQWQHHAKDLNDDCGILHWVADQYGGQVKGEVHKHLINAAGDSHWSPSDEVGPSTPRTV